MNGSELSASLVWMIVAIAMIFMMQAGFSCLEAGLVRAKNTVNVIMKNFIDVALVTLPFWAVGYGLMWGANPSGWLGTSDFFVSGTDNAYLVNMLFQLMFCATSSTIVSGAIAERIRYGAFVAVATVISVLTYPIFGSWAWGGTAESPGWLRGLGFIDVAGGTVVHIVGGACALAGVIVLGARRGRFSSQGIARVIPGHNLPVFSIGVFLLWFGWFGFNGASAMVDFPERVGLALLNTHLGACAGVAGAMLFVTLRGRKVAMATAMNGALGGLVSVTAGCAHLAPPLAIFTALVAGVLVTVATTWLERLRLDDAVGAVPVHLCCGIWGTVAVGLFQTNQMFDLRQIGVQLLGAAVAFIWAFATAWLAFKTVGKFMLLRVPSISEQRGLDISEHGEIGYAEFQDSLADPSQERG